MTVTRNSRLMTAFAVIVLTGLLAACGGEDLAPPTPTKTPAPFIVTNTPPATEDPVLSAAQGELIEAGPTDFPPDVNPLTGLTVEDPATLDRKPVVVVVSNSPPEDVRPQAGLSFADTVWEYFTEGGVTRYAAVFLSGAPEAVGSVRSCRLIMLEISQMYDALWTCSGYSTGVGERIRAASNYGFMIDGSAWGEPYLRRVDDEPWVTTGVAPHNLFASPNDIWNWAGEPERDFTNRTIDGLYFNTLPPEGGSPATSVQVDYKGAGFRPEWRYDADSGQYLRFDEGQPYVDPLTEKQLSFDNVVVIGAQEVITDIVEDSFGARALEQQVWGSGPLTLFRDGQSFEGEWRRDNRSDLITYYDLNGNVLALRPGETWVQVVPLGFDRITVQP